MKKIENKAELYLILEIDRTASYLEIKRAYLKLCKKFHPDKGGNTDDFHLLKNAFEILSDPIKREKYDKTGEFSNTEEFEIEEKAKGIFITSFLEAVNQYGDKVFQVDVIARIVSNTYQNIQKFETNKKKNKTKISFLEKVKTKIIKKSEGINLIEKLLEEQILQLENHLIKIDNDLVLCEKVNKLCEDYKFNRESILNSYIGTSTSSSSIFNWRDMT